MCCPLDCDPNWKGGPMPCPECELGYHDRPPIVGWFTRVIRLITDWRQG